MFECWFCCWIWYFILCFFLLCVVVWCFCGVCVWRRWLIDMFFLFLCEFWVYIVLFLLLCDWEILFETCVEICEGVIFFCECACMWFFVCCGYFFENEYGLLCVDEEEVGFYVCVLFWYMSVLLTMKRDVVVKFCVAMTAAFFDAFDDLDFEMIENECVDWVLCMMKVVSVELSYRCCGKVVGLFLWYEIDDLETAIGVGEFGLVEYEFFDMNEDKEECIKYEWVLLWLYLWVFIVMYVVFGLEMLLYLYIESSYRYDLEVAFVWKAFTIGFMGLFIMWELMSVELLCMFMMLNVCWFFLNLYKNGIVYVMMINVSEMYLILDSIVDLYSKSIDIEIVIFC